MSTDRERIERLLAHHRPDRYNPADKAWQEPVVALVAAGLLVGAAAGIAGALAAEGLARRVRVLADELADLFDGWLG